MFAIAYLILIGTLAFYLQPRIALLRSFKGAPRYLCSLGLTLFLVNWINFLLFVVMGAGELYLAVSGLSLFLLLGYFSEFWKFRVQPWQNIFGSDFLERPGLFRKWNFWFVFLCAFVVVRFYVGIDVDPEGNVWTTFNFVDTAFHLSVTNAFLAASHFPPMDLDMAPYPLKYHFLADFNVAHLVRLGISPLTAMWLMNLVSGTVMVGALWATFEHWLKLPPRWVALAGLIFLFLNTSLLNLVHFLVLKPNFFDAHNLYYGLFHFPYFNFESSLNNMLQPQRGLLFSLPVVLLILHAAFGERDESEPGVAARIMTLQALVLTCLLPLAHIVAFAVAAPCLIPSIWKHRLWVIARWRVWLPAFLLGVLQLLYLGAYGPPTNAGFSAWGLVTALPLQDFSRFPSSLRRVVFWFFVDGDFLFWGLFFAGWAFIRRRHDDPAGNGSARVRFFVRQWKWYFAVCLFFFALINIYRYSFDWGDSNKFVFFLNLGLTLIITLGAAQWSQREHRYASHALWFFFLLLTLAPPCYSFYDNVLASGHGAGTVLLFEKNGRAAAQWARTSVEPGEIFLTAAYNTLHFVTPLAGRPTVAGIYGDSNPYRQDERQEEVRRIYEEGNLPLLRKLEVHYVCISRNERRKYTLHPKWLALMRSGVATAFHAGGGPEDYHSVFILDCRKFRSP